MTMKKYKATFSAMYKRDLKRIGKRNLDKNKLNTVINLLECDEPLPEKNRDHALTGNWKGYRECHIEPDWLLVYRKEEERLILVLMRTGSHSDLDF